VGGLDCPTCAAKVERAVGRIDGITSARLNVATSVLTLTYDPGCASPDQARREIVRLGYRVEDPGAGQPGSWLSHHGGWLQVAIAAGALIAALGAEGGRMLGAWPLPAIGHLGADRPVTATTLLFALAMVVGGYGIARQAFRALRHRQFDINLLMLVAAVGAAVIWQWAEGASAMVLFSLALLLEARAMGRARRAFQSLMSLVPPTARVRRDGGLVEVPAVEVRTGEVVLVRPGETIPLDGCVLTGSTEVNQAPITGESVPVARGPGDDVFAGTVNGQGVLEVRSTRPAGDTTVARILHLVQDAQSARAPSQQFVDRFARWYTPAVIVGALLVATVPPLVFDGPWTGWLFRALVLLVVACPCALVISTPVSVVSALASAARRGILIKGGAHLENLARARTFIFDKTGTLTGDTFTVVQVTALGTASERDVVAVAAAVETHSEHLLARAILGAASERDIDPEEGRDARSLPGRGAEALVAGQVCRAGNLRLFEDLGLAGEEARRLAGRIEAEGHTAMLVSRGQALLGAIALADRPREGASAALAELRRLGARDLVMLTGDNEATARAVAGAVGIDHVHAALLPEDKLEKVRFLTRRDGATAMVGDGVNDAPALAAATVGIAMGAAGTDAALETADVALMTDRLDRMPEAVSLGRRTVRIIGQNVGLALGLKLLFLALAVANLATLWMAVAADMGASLLVIANGLRLLGKPKG